MNDYRKISLVNEFNEETKEWEVRTVVFFRNGEAPLIEDFNGEEHLREIAGLIESAGLNILDNGLANACQTGIVSVVKREDTKQMAELNSEILQEQIRYSNTQQEEIEEVQEMKETAEVEKTA